MPKTLYILRGLAGSGKSTRAKTQCPGLTPFALAPAGYSPVSVSADHFFTTLSGEYHFSPAKLGEAHAQASCQLVKALSQGREVIVVDNTHTQRWEFALALTLAKAFDYNVEIVEVFDGGGTDEELAERNTHGVPLDVITKQRARWEDSA